MHPSGGYLIHRLPLIRTGHNTHSAALDRPTSHADIDAINAVQATPWRVNTWILDVMQEAWTKGLRLGGLEVNEPLVLDRLPDDVWAGMSPGDRNDYIARRVEIHAQNAQIMGRSRAILDALSVAEELRDKPAIYYPHA